MSDVVAPPPAQTVDGNIVGYEHQVILPMRFKLAKERIAIWKEYVSAKGTKLWRLFLTAEFAEWAEASLTDSFHLSYVSVPVDEYGRSPSVMLEWENRARGLVLYGHEDKVQGEFEKVKRLQGTFKNELDAVKFKLRWWVA